MGRRKRPAGEGFRNGSPIPTSPCLRPVTSPPPLDGTGNSGLFTSTTPLNSPFSPPGQISGRPLRILLLTDYFPPHGAGGVEAVVAVLARGLASRGHSVMVLTLQTGAAPLREHVGGHDVIRVPASDLSGVAGLQAACAPGLYSALRRACRDFTPDIVHAHNLFFRTTETAVLPGVLPRLPLIVTLHLGRSDGVSPLALALRAYEETVGRLVLRRAAAVIAVSHAVGRLAQRLAPARTPVTVIPNTVDLTRFSPAAEGQSDPMRVLFVGRLVHNKGPAVFLHAARLALEQEPGIRFVMAGSGPLEGRLKSLARKLRIDGSVDFLGQRADVPDLLRSATVLVRPSTLEGMPLTVLEAMATGLPVIATSVGGTPELVEDGVTGYLVRPGDTRAVAAAVLRMARAPDLAISMGRTAVERVQQRPTQGMAIDMNELVYNKALRQ